MRLLLDERLHAGFREVCGLHIREFKKRAEESLLVQATFEERRGWIGPVTRVALKVCLGDDVGLAWVHLACEGDVESRAHLKVLRPRERVLHLREEWEGRVQMRVVAHVRHWLEVGAAQGGGAYGFPGALEGCVHTRTAPKALAPQHHGGGVPLALPLARLLDLPLVQEACVQELNDLRPAPPEAVGAPMALDEAHAWPGVYVHGARAHVR
mmetsp:Transcript_22699/g.61480  ORF Transcript_22699/g.61480 Transcript_22699/m.61480 type:complete len:211 (-) Transcript_22699:287-919(-)